MLTVREAFFEVARQLGLTTMFGNPGSTEEPFLKDFPTDFRYVLALQEAPAVAMADAYSQRTGRPALVNLHTAAGMGNAVGNIESAWYNRAPLIITAGQQTREMLLLEPYLTNVHPELVPQPFVKWAYQPARAEDVPAALMRAYAAAVLPPAGPVFLSIPMDDGDQPCPRLPMIRTVSRRLSADQDALAAVIAALTEARSPVLVIGGAVDQADGWDDAVALAEKLQCAVWAAPEEGRPGFPETHPLYQGALPPAIGPLAQALAGHDVIVVVGAPVFRYYPYVPGEYLPAGAELFHITDDPSEAARAPVGTAVLADPGRSCAVLAAAVPQASSVGSRHSTCGAVAARRHDYPGVAVSHDSSGAADRQRHRPRVAVHRATTARSDTDRQVQVVLRHVQWRARLRSARCGGRGIRRA